MDIVDSRLVIKNSKLLWLILGAFLIPVYNSIESLIGGLFKVIGLSLIDRIKLSIGLQSTVIIALLAILFWTLKTWRTESPSRTVVTLKDFKLYGFVFLAILVAGRVVSFFILTNISEEIDLLEESQTYDLLRDSLNLQLVSGFLLPLREIMMFVIYFVVVFKNKMV